MSKFIIFDIWMRHLERATSGGWTLTNHTVKARSDKEAQSKVRRSFARAGFSNMSLAAVVHGTNPNQTAQEIGE
jgi:hypothetical protein